MSKESALAAATAAPSSPGAPEAPPVEGTTAQNPSEGTQSVDLESKRFAALARKEQEIVAKQTAFKKEQEIHAAEKVRVQEALKKAQDFETLRQTDPIAAMKSLGFSETEIFNFFAEQKPKTEPTLEEKAAKIAEEVAAKKIKESEEAATKKAEEEKKARDAELIGNFRGEISNYLETNKETHPYCAYFGKIAEDQAYENIVAVLSESGGKELITVKEAMQLAEDFYREQDEAMSKIRKPKEPEAPVEAPKDPTRTRTVTPGDPTQKVAPSIQRTRQLSNDMRATSASTIPKNETYEQKKERLIAQIKAHGLRK